jgi:demethylmenaquinone methyltransferase/2-methoxy-6-polyprenyl-1,4-benzoquinol methylase
MFDRIVRRYDLMNRVMTGGQDVRWRKKAVRYAREAGSACALDVATGTGDLALALRAGGFRQVIGLDFVPAMIDAAERKRAGSDGVRFVVGDALRLPFSSGAFDALTVSFGLRNMVDYEAALREMGRVLRPGGRLVCLELTPYRTRILGTLFNAYFRHVIPRVGAWLTGDRAAYEYLPESVANFPDAATLSAMLTRVGFASVHVEKVGGGTVAIHVATKSA